MKEGQALAQLFSAFLAQVAEARMNADQYSAEISKQYLKDDILRHFSVPRLDIENLTVDMKFAIGTFDPETNKLSVIVEAEALRELNPAAISSFTFTTKMRNYTWVEGRPEDDGGFKLIETT
ncbi:MAG: Uncharacterized protein FD123_831 [Bacteroidetes bacterium]|nr:MAG: Uncharacterized protein FD123_831 [Bacteroidota bacterium]